MLAWSLAFLCVADVGWQRSVMLREPVRFSSRLGHLLVLVLYCQGSVLGLVNCDLPYLKSPGFEQCSDYRTQHECISQYT